MVQTKVKRSMTDHTIERKFFFASNHIFIESIKVYPSNNRPGKSSCRIELQFSCFGIYSNGLAFGLNRDFINLLDSKQIS
jgi:hypothetical protein